MNEIERSLRELGERARRDVGPLAPRPRDVGRIKRRRAALAGVTAVSLVLVAAGSYALANRDERGTLPPVHSTPTSVASPGPCGLPLDFSPTVLPRGFDGIARPGSAGDDSLPVGANGIVANFRGDEQGTFIDVVANRPAYAQTSVDRIAVLGAEGTIGEIEDGYSVEFWDGGCRYTLLAYGVSETQLRRFAQSFALTGDEDGFGAVWPEDTAIQADIGCAEATDNSRRSPTSVALAFATDVLDWSPLSTVSHDDGKVDLFRSSSSGSGDRPDLEVYTDEVFFGCWSVQGVARPDDGRPTGISISVKGHDASIGFAPLGAETVTVELGYGRHLVSKTWNRGTGDPLVELRLRRAPTTTGHYLMIMRDASGEVVTATGGPLPPGNFVAG